MDIAGKRVTVMGLGRFGGGVGVARFLVAEGARVVVTDLDSPENLAGPMAAVGPDVAYHLGGHREEDFTEADLVVVNPAVPPRSDYLRLARDAGVPVTTEINLFFERCPARTIGVTGSVGKTTTVSMLGRALEAGTGRTVWVGGNIGGSLLGELDCMSGDDLAVLELSSAQLYRLGPTGLAPGVAVVLNVSENHIDWHGSMADYVAAKKQIIAGSDPRAVAVLNHDDPIVRGWAADAPGRVVFYSASERPTEGLSRRGNELVWKSGRAERPVLDTAGMVLPGEHNVANAAAALAACAVVGADLDRAGAALAAFEGAEHRLQFVREIAGVRFYNDSKATTPTAALAALRAFDRPISLILGGRDKGVSYAELADETSRCRAVVLTGEMAGPLETLIGERQPSVRTERVPHFIDAVHAAARLARPGDVVLLSPACTSYDQFKNFEQRGARFIETVTTLRPADVGPG